MEPSNIPCRIWAIGILLYTTTIKPDFRVEIRPKPLPGLKKVPFPTITLMETFCSDRYQ